MKSMDTHNRVVFEKPDLAELTRRYTVVDFHFHSRYSDGKNDIPSIVEKARRLGIGIAITDHNSIEGAVEIDGYGDILTIPGIEITAREGAHLLVYFYSIEDLKHFFSELEPYLGKKVMISTRLSMESLISLARNYQSVIIFPHPFSAFYTGICNPVFDDLRQKTLLRMADGIEVINAGNLHRWNLESTVLGFNMETSLVGGSDGHHVSHMGRAVTCAPCERDRAVFLDSVREGITRVVGKEINLLRKVGSGGTRMRSNMSTPADLMGKNVRYGTALINRQSRRFRDNIRSLRVRKAKKRR